jgi:hypothetical protein
MVGPMQDQVSDVIHRGRKSWSAVRTGSDDEHHRIIKQGLISSPAR